MTKSDDRAAIHSRLRQAIETAGGIQCVADGVGTTYQAIHWWWSGRTVPGALTLARFCRAFQVSADWILFGELRK